MKTKNSLILFAITIIAVACSTKGSNKSLNNNEEDELFHHGPPLINVFFVPMDGVSSATIEQLKEDFTTKFTDKQWEPYNVEILEPMTTPDSCFNSEKTRYRAEKMVKTISRKYAAEIKKEAKEKDWAYYIVGVTDKDISTAIHNKPDYGIMGLSYLGKGDTSVISTYRIKRKKDLWKLAAHEFCHGFYGCPHCKNDDPYCIMADAKGGNPHFEIKESLCLDCGNFCLIGD